MTEVPASGAVLTWAREFRGLSQDEAAVRLGITTDKLELVETEVKHPSVSLFEKMGSVYRLPLATLFRRTKPEDPPRMSDFRTYEGSPPRDSFDFSVALSNVRTLQATLKFLEVEDTQFFHAKLRNCDLTGNPYQQGERERDLIGVTVDAQLRWPSGDGFRHWRAVIERLGVSVYLQKYPLNDSLGCALIDEDEPPAILINKNQTENGRIYTLIHEYAHLLVRKPGISDLNRRDPVEVWCNRFAAAFLMPVVAMRRVLPNWPNGPQDWGHEAIRDAAKALKVSAQAFAIRLEELGKAQEGFNRQFAVKAKAAEHARLQYHVRRLSELGGRFTTSVIQALDREVIDEVRASQALALRPSSFGDARHYVDRQRELAGAE